MFVAAYRNTERGAKPALLRMERLRREAELAERRRKAEAERLVAEAERAERLRWERVVRMHRERQESIRAAFEARIADTSATFARIQELACRVFKVSPADIRGDARYKELVFARQFIAYWASRRTKLSMPKIGILMNRDHSTIVHAKRVYPAKRAQMGRYLKPARSRP